MRPEYSLRAVDDAPEIRAAQPLSTAIELSIIVPTYNERQNVRNLVSRVERALPGTQWELVFVDDDSPDHTADLVRELGQSDRRIRCVHRYRRTGLSSACVEGIMNTSSPYVAVMDGDLQHDESKLPAMLEVLKQEGVDVVVGSRNASGGGMGDFDALRQKMSQFATRLASLATPTPLSDPMSGFFMIRRKAFLEALPRLSMVGYKILLDIIASSPRPVVVREVPYRFRSRQAGDSKLDATVLWEYLLLLLEKILRRRVSAEFLSFALIGGVGVLVHFTVLAVLFRFESVSFAPAEIAATTVAISGNFLLNNLFTYRSRRLRGLRMLSGWVSFNLVCAASALANVGIATWLFRNHAGWGIAALCGVLVGVAWNFAMSSMLVWRRT